MKTCRARVYLPSGRYHRRCMNRATTERSGSPVCSVHARKFDEWDDIEDAPAKASFWWYPR